jgi:hypothetical protein
MYLVKKAAYKYAMLKLSEVRKVQVELTTRCNARCPMCMRNYRGLDYNSGYPVTELTLQQFQHIFTPEFCQQLTGVEPIIDGFRKKYFGQAGVSFNGNLGDFASARDAVEIVEYLVQHQVPVHVNTNGSLRTPDWWRKLAQPGVTVGFALDGLADTHHLYRQDTDWHKIIANAQAFIGAGGQAVWRFVPFDHNRHQEDQCRQLAQHMGFVKFENIYDGRDSGPVFTRTGEYSHRIGTDSGPAGHQPRVEDLLANHITWFDSRTVKSHKDVPDLNLRCIHKNQSRNIHSRRWVSISLLLSGILSETMHHAGNAQTKQLVQENNALEYDLAHCLNWFERVEQTWAQSSIADGRLYQCVNSCSIT